MWSPPSRRRVRALRDRLREFYGRPAVVPHHAPVDELILTVLSQSTSDRNRDVAFLRLKERFAGVEAAIQPGGLHRQKSVRIQAILRALPEPLPPDWLADQARLTSLPGVGRKTAACVRLFAYGERDIPVDTHVSRVGTRLGLFRPKAGFEEMHDHMLALTPRGQELEFHVNLLRHGRRVCHAQRPRCGECPLRRMCPKVGVG
jgi:endonuclease-3